MGSATMIALLLAACAPCLGVDRDFGPAEGPVLLASGDAFTISAFEGAVQESDAENRLVRPGTVIFHTDRKTGKSTWMIRTGTFEVPTRRVSYSVSRLLGLCQTDTHMAAVLYIAMRIWDRPPRDPSPETGEYRLVVFEKATGRRVSDVQLDLPDGPPDRVPEETTALGVIEKTESGFVALGTRILEE